MVALLSVNLDCAQRPTATDNQLGQNGQSSDLPPGFYDQLDHLKSLHMDYLPVQDLKWLHSNNLSELEIKQLGLRSVTGISGAKKLNKVSLNLNRFPVSSLREVCDLKQLGELTIFSGSSENAHLADLASCNIHRLKLVVPEGDTPDLSGLANIQSLRTLQITINDDYRIKRPGFTLRGLEAVTQINTLILDLQGSAIQELPDFSVFPNLQTLELNLQETTKITSLANLKTKSTLTSLRLNLNGSLITDLPDFDNLRGLTTLELTLNRSAHLPPTLIKLTELKSLDLDVSGSDVKVLPDFDEFSKLAKVNLIVNPQGIADLSPLGRASAVTNLRICLTKYSKIRDISFLKKLKSLTTLDLDIADADINNLGVLAKIETLQSLTIRLQWAHVGRLPNLSRLPAFHEFTVSFGGYLEKAKTAVRLSHVMKLVKPRKLVLNLGGTQIERLPGLPEGVHDLTLDLSNSEIKSLEGLSQATQLHMLNINLQGSGHIEKLPHMNELKSLGCVSLNLQGIGIDISTLVEPEKLTSLFLDLQDSKIEKLPELNHSHLEHASLILLNAAIANWQVIQKWEFLDNLSVDDRFPSFGSLPLSVTSLNLDERPPLESCGAER